MGAARVGCAASSNGANAEGGKVKQVEQQPGQCCTGTTNSQVYQTLNTSKLHLVVFPQDYRKKIIFTCNFLKNSFYANRTHSQ